MDISVIKNLKLPKNIKFIVAGAIVLAAGISIFLSYEKEAKKLNAQISKVNEKSADIEEKINKVKAIKKERERRLVLYDVFPRKEEQGLRTIFNTAKSRDIEVNFVEPQPKEMFYDGARNALAKDGLTAYSISVTLKIKCVYADLVEYIRGLGESLHGFITIENLSIVKEDFEKDARKVEMGLKLYVLQ